MTSNNALIPDPDKEDVLASKPIDWPLMHLGLRMCGWADNQVKYYLLGTPVIWWSGTLSLILSLVALSIYLLRMQRRYNDFEPGMLSNFISRDIPNYVAGEWDHFLYVGKVAFVGWSFHYCEYHPRLMTRNLTLPIVPFLVMGRVSFKLLALHNAISLCFR